MSKTGELLCGEILGPAVQAFFCLAYKVTASAE